MNNGKYQKILQEADTSGSKFMNFGKWLVDSTYMPSGAPITGDERRVLITLTSGCMALGSELTKGKYLIIGGIIGFGVGVYLTNRKITQLKSKG